MGVQVGEMTHLNSRRRHARDSMVHVHRVLTPHARGYANPGVEHGERHRTGGHVLSVSGPASPQLQA